MRTTAIFFLVAGLLMGADYPLEPVPFTKVRITEGFWLPRMETNRTVTVPYDFKKCEETGRISNFAKAGGLMEGDFEGIFFNDSDVFKVVEGACYSLAIHHDPELEAYLDRLIAWFAAAQEDDGYLYTARTIDPENPARGAGEERWSNTRHGHELYNVGHMYEAAVAHFMVTGKRTFLDVAIRNADLIDSVFGPGKRMEVPGHQEIEIGLVKLHLATGERRYLDLAKFFLDQRGNPEGHALYGPYCQDHEPVVWQWEAVGHAVRAGYMYSGMADVAALTGNKDYIRAIDRIWEDVVYRKLYLTGGIGARHAGEAFGDDYELPNATAYNETCAAIANALWNHRLFLLHGHGKYIDVLERILYNGFLSGVSLSGDRFFYPNPLASYGEHERSPWFNCSCCPTNVVRFMPSIPGFAYARQEGSLYVNLYIPSRVTMDWDGKPLCIEQETLYPWDGEVKLTVEPAAPLEATLFLRIPGWARNQPVPGDLYRYLRELDEAPVLKVNGAKINLEIQKGFAVIQKRWTKGDCVELRLPMPVRRVMCNEKVESNQGLMALERGPVVFCVEGVDNGGYTRNLVLPEDLQITPRYDRDLLGGVIVLEAEALGLHRTEHGETIARPQSILALPYYAWAHRGKGEMQVWLPMENTLVLGAEEHSVADVKVDVLKPLPAPTIAFASRIQVSHACPSDTVTALNDQIEPGHSNDHSIPRFTWWDHRGTSEWVQYDFSEDQEVSVVEVYWFDDAPRGGRCRVPASWSLLYREGGAWKKVKTGDDFGVEKDRFNRVSFETVRTGALRLEAALRPGQSSGILEWRVYP
jgi:DUF1680 family protein